MKDRVTIPALMKKRQRGEKIVMLTCYDTAFARLVDATSVDIVLVGDSVGDNVLGYENTVPVTLDEMIHHARAVRRGTRRALTVVDMPFMSYQVSVEEALRAAGRLLKETGVEAVKVEGGCHIAPTIERLTRAGIPVMGHVGLTPQSVNQLGGYRIQGRDSDSAERIIEDAVAVATAGAFATVLELVPADVARRVTEASPVPIIGIGAGPDCDGQVQVLHDVLGLAPDRSFRHVRRYAEIGRLVQEAVQSYAAEVRQARFPEENNGY